MKLWRTMHTLTFNAKKITAYYNWRVHTRSAVTMATIHHHVSDVPHLSEVKSMRKKHGTE